MYMLLIDKCLLILDACPQVIYLQESMIKHLEATDLYNDACQILLSHQKLNTSRLELLIFPIKSASLSLIFLILVNDPEAYRVAQARTWESSPPPPHSSVPRTSSLQVFEFSPFYLLSIPSLGPRPPILRSQLNCSLAQDSTRI